MKKRKKRLYYLFSFVFIFTATSLFFIWSIYIFLIKPEVFRVKRIPFSLHENSLNSNREIFILQLEQLMERLEKEKKKDVFIVNNTFPPHILEDTIKEFYTLYKKNLSEEEFKREFLTKFNLYKINSIKNKVLITGYFMPEINASLEKRQGFDYPIYARPNDEKKPYYTRHEIDWEKREINAPVLAWISSPVDGMMLHVQGSGILIFNGTKRNVGYASNNGHQYGSICRYFIRKKMFTKEDCTWENIRKIWLEDPNEFINACKENPRYIFFMWQDREGAYGSAGLRLLEEKSVAADPDFYPIGIPFIVRSKNYMGLALNLDRGAAIKGIGRLDVFFGEGENALEKAQKMRDKGDIYFFLKKNPLLEGVKGWR